MSSALEDLELLKLRIPNNAINRGCINDIEKELNELEIIKVLMTKYGIKTIEELEHIILNDATGEQVFKDYRDSVEKDLEILEIIKKKRVNVGLIKICDDYQEYNRIKLPKENKLLTETKFNLIKEWLENE